MSEQEMVLLKQLEEKKRSLSEDFLYVYLKDQLETGAGTAGKEPEPAQQ